MRFVATSFFVLFLGIFCLKAEIVLGVVPQQSPMKLLKIWKPVVAYLTQATSQEIRFKTEKSIQLFSKKLYSGSYDLAYMSPLHFVLVNTQISYEPLVRSDKEIHGILVVHKDRSADILKDQNLKIFFPSPDAFAATVLIQYDLAQKFKVDLDVLQKARFVNSHDSVYRGIARGLGDVGGGIERTFNFKHNARVRDQLKIIHKSKGYATHPFAVRSTLSPEVKEKLRKALLNMPKDLLESLNMKAMKKADKSEYRDVELLVKKLGIKVE